MIPDRVGLFGLSLGSIVAFLLATESTLVKARSGPNVHYCCFNSDVNVCVCVSAFVLRLCQRQPLERG